MVPLGWRGEGEPGGGLLGEIQSLIVENQEVVGSEREGRKRALERGV
jgi:hypothetical protein